VSWLNPRKERRMVVVGSKKMVEFDDVAPDKLHIYDRGYDRPPAFASFAEYLTLRNGDVTIPQVPMVEPLAAELAHFLDCIVDGTPPAHRRRQRCSRRADAGRGPGLPRHPAGVSRPRSRPPGHTCRVRPAPRRAHASRRPT
jgi:predicted dehydrogenase